MFTSTLRISFIYLKPVQVYNKKTTENVFAYIFMLNKLKQSLRNKSNLKPENSFNYLINFYHIAPLKTIMNKKL